MECRCRTKNAQLENGAITTHMLWTFWLMWLDDVEFWILGGHLGFMAAILD